MQKSDQKRLQEKLAGLSEQQRRQLYKMAAKMRKSAMTRTRGRSANLTKEYHDGRFDDRDGTSDSYRQRSGSPGRGGAFEKRSGHGPTTLDEWVLKLLEQEQLDSSGDAPQTQAEMHSGMVISIKAGSCGLLCQNGRCECLLRPEFAIAQRSDLAVGDIVDFSTAKDGTYFVEHIHARKSTLSRPDPHNPRIERVIGANIDVAVIVISVSDPPLNTNLIDRYLLATERGGVTPLICVNKIDLVASEEDASTLKTKLEPYNELNIKVLYCSAKTGQAIEEMAEQLSGKLGVFVGHSGVGKSSLLNAIYPELALPVGSVRKKNKKGCHTTAGSMLYELPHDVRIIDTPGIRSFGLWKVSMEELQMYFSEFDEFSPLCKFANCSHTHEPDCNVKRALEDGKILPTRYKSYCRLLETLME